MVNQKIKLFETRNNIPVETRQQLIDLLNQQLADTFDMVSLVKQAHWNIKGPLFIALHKLFDELADGLLGHVDSLAERVTALGGLAMGTVRMAAGASRLAAYPADLTADLATVEFLADQMAKLAASTRAAADQAESLSDMATNDLFIEVVRDLDKWAWFLEAHLQS
jgi:starvation-inducible DNA-binding protein